MKLTRTETIELPSWEELKNLQRDKTLATIFINENSVYLLEYKETSFFELVEYGLFGNFQDFEEFENTEQGYNQAIAKICELGGFEIEIKVVEDD